MSLRIWGLLLLLSVLWGGSFFFAKVAVSGLPPLTLVFSRVALAAFVLNLLGTLAARSIFHRNTPWSAYLVMGMLNNVLPFSLIFWGQTHIASGLASILNATTPLFTVAVVHLFTTEERMTPSRIGALAAGFLGVAVLIGPAALEHAGTGLLGQAACLLAALSYAFAGLYGRRFVVMGVTPLEAAAGQLTASTMLILPIMLLVDGTTSFASWHPPVVWEAVVCLALLSTALAYVLYFRILAVAGPTNLLLVTFLIPVTATLLGMAFLGEELAFRQIAGMLLVGAGLVLVDGRVVRALRLAK